MLGYYLVFLSAEVTMTADVIRPVAIKIDPEIKARVKRLADARHRTPHWLMREAIKQYVEREEKREAFRQGTLHAWDEYRTTGLHATAEEVEAWLSSWGTDHELPAPVCHT
jgi:predicted transcriptional regulator